SGSWADGAAGLTETGSKAGTDSGTIVREPLAVRGARISEGPARAAGLAGIGVTVMVAAAGLTWPGAERTSLWDLGVGVAAGWLPARLTIASVRALVGPA